MTEAEQLAWHIEWRRRARSAFRLWLNATGYRDGCDRLTDLKAVFNQTPPGTNHIPKGKEPTKCL